MAQITVNRVDDKTFTVEVEEGTGKTVHKVTATPDDIRQYGGNIPPETLIEKSFEFLLEREPKESILRSFNLPVIERYFPEYPTEIQKYLG